MMNARKRFEEARAAERRAELLRKANIIRSILSDVMPDRTPPHCHDHPVVVPYSRLLAAWNLAYHLCEDI